MTRSLGCASVHRPHTLQHNACHDCFQPLNSYSMTCGTYNTRIGVLLYRLHMYLVKHCTPLQGNRWPSPEQLCKTVELYMLHVRV